jgi:hypothetical protein
MTIVFKFPMGGWAAVNLAVAVDPPNPGTTNKWILNEW